MLCRAHASKRRPMQRRAADLETARAGSTSTLSHLSRCNSSTVGNGKRYHSGANRVLKVVSDSNLLRLQTDTDRPRARLRRHGHTATRDVEIAKTTALRSPNQRYLLDAAWRVCRIFQAQEDAEKEVCSVQPPDHLTRSTHQAKMVDRSCNLYGPGSLHIQTTLPWQNHALMRPSIDMSDVDALGAMQRSEPTALVVSILGVVANADLLSVSQVERPGTKSVPMPRPTVNALSAVATMPKPGIKIS